VKISGEVSYGLPLSKYDCIDMRTVALPDGKHVPVLGQGTWKLGESKSARAGEISALRLGIELGMTLIDTAEMYGDGGAEDVVGESIHGQHKDVFVVTKIYPHNASHVELPKACQGSLTRLGLEAIDLYLLHWRERRPPLRETVETFEELRLAGSIRRWGVSNFDVDDMNELMSLEQGRKCSANQVLYNLENREIEFDLLPWSRTHKIPIMAYSPVGHSGELLKNAVLRKIANRHNATPAQVALAWVLRQPEVIAIPKASTERHVRDNANSLKIKLTEEDLTALDREFPPPKSKKPLPML
jgi:diketogulonate reductase-like aldo/keto reductase